MQEITPQQEMAFQEKLQNNQISSDPNAIYADSMRDEKVKNVIAQLNPEWLLSEIEHRIRGEKKVFAGGVEVGWELIDKEHPQISEELVQNYIAFLNVYLTQNNSLSNFSAEEINNIMAVVIDYVRDDLTDNAEKYGLTKKRYIKVQVTNYVLQPKDNGDGNFYMEQIPIQVVQSIPAGEEQTDYNTLSKIGHIVCQSTFSVLKQAQGGKLAERIFKALRVSENLNDGGKKSKMDLLKFW